MITSLFVYSSCNSAVNNWSYTASDGFDDNDIWKPYKTTNVMH